MEEFTRTYLKRVAPYIRKIDPSDPAVFADSSYTEMDARNGVFAERLKKLLNNKKWVLEKRQQEGKETGFIENEFNFLFDLYCHLTEKAQMAQQFKAYLFRYYNTVIYQLASDLYESQCDVQVLKEALIADAAEKEFLNSYCIELLDRVGQLKKEKA